MNALLHTGYEDYLRKLTAKYFMWLSTNSFTSREEGLEEAREMMQQRYPGNYVLHQVYNYHRGAFELAVKFDNPKEEMLWKMKWA